MLGSAPHLPSPVTMPSEGDVTAAASHCGLKWDGVIGRPPVATWKWIARGERGHPDAGFFDGERWQRATRSSVIAPTAKSYPSG